MSKLNLLEYYIRDKCEITEESTTTDLIRFIDHIVEGTEDPAVNSMAAIQKARKLLEAKVMRLSAAHPTKKPI